MTAKKDIPDRMLRVGELARAVGKSVRAIHLYEELGLVTPAQRSTGGFRLFTEDAVERITWITKLQAIGFSLSDIQGFVQDFGSATSGRAGAERVRGVFERKLAEIRNTLAQLQLIEHDLVDALVYLQSCTGCQPTLPVTECGVCTHQGHEPAEIPELFAGLSQPARDDYDVDIAQLRAKDHPHH